VDWVGSLIFALALAALFVGATHLADLSGAAIFESGGMLLYLFVRWNNKANFPLVRLDLLLQNTRFIRSVTAALFMYGSQYGIVLMMALYLQYNRGLSPTEAGQLMMLQALMMTVCAPIAGRLSDRLGRRILATTGSIAISVGLMLLTQMDGQMPLWMIGVAIMIIGTGHGLFSTPNNSSALAAIPSARVGIGSAIISLARQSGQLMGTAVISLLLAIYFDGAAITAEDSKQFETVAHLALYVSLGFALCAAWFSWKRDPV
jgi:MFS family permease